MNEVVVRRSCEASPDLLWSMVSDVTRMGEWSPEATGASWVLPADGPAVGAVFRGTNARGSRRWSTTCTVTMCEPGKSFGFSVRGGGMAVSEWLYEFDEVDGGSVVTESWFDRRGIVLKLYGVAVLRIANRAEHNRRTMEATLSALCQVARRG